MTFLQNGQDISTYFAKISDYNLYVNFPGAQVLGNNSAGQLGLADLTNRSSPVAIAIGTWLDVSYLRSGIATAYVGSDYSGWFTGGLPGFDSTNRVSPSQVTLSNWTQVSGGLVHTASIQSNGTLWAWGNNSYGQLGLGDTTGRGLPVEVGNLSTWTQVSAGLNQTMAIQLSLIHI